MVGFTSDMRWASRLIRRRRLFAATVVLTLAVAISAVVTAAGIATAVLWRPLPFAEPDRLAFVWEDTGDAGAIEPARVTGYRFSGWQRDSRSFSSMALFAAAGFLTERDGAARSVNGVRVSTNYFDTLGISPLLGRRFTDSDGEPGARPVVILSRGLWEEWLGGRADVIGQDVRLDGRPYTVVGIMPGVVFPAWPVNPAIVTLDPDSRRLWIPIERTPALAAASRSHVFGVLARLQPRTSIDDAAAELTGLVKRSDPDPHHAIVRHFRDQFVRDARLPLIALLSAAFAVFVVACTNLAALQRAAIENRRLELNVRAALGAGRFRLVRQFSIEATVLAGAGGAIGVLLSQVMLVRIPQLLPPSVPLLTTPATDLNAALIALAVSGGAATSLAAWPLTFTRATPEWSGRGTTPITRSIMFRSLVIVQVALAMALVTAAALLQQSLNTVRSQDPGFVVDRVLVATITLAGPAYRDVSQVVTAERRLTSALARLPGAAAVSFAYDHPLEANWIDSFTLLGTAEREDDAHGSAELRIVSPSYFETMGVAVVEGRALSEHDELGAPGAVVVNEAFARRVAGGRVLNRTLRSGTPRLAWNDPRVPDEFRIVGMVEDERFKGLELPSEPAVYMSTRQFPQQGMTMLIRTRVKPTSLAGTVRNVVKAVDPGVPLEDVSALSSILAEQLVTRRATTEVIDGFAAAALLLAGFGLYGLLALLVAARRRETGIRFALGSSPAREAGRVARECTANTALGVACGAGLALLTGRFLQNLLVGVSGRDMRTLAIAAGMMLAVAIVAATLPAWRTARVDPASLLRGEI